MKTNLSLLLLFIVILSVWGCSKKEVNGELCIIDKGIVLYKFGLVPVSFLTEQQYKIATDTNSTKYREYIEQLNILDSTENHNKWMVRFTNATTEHNRFIKSYKEHQNIYGLTNAGWKENSDYALKKAKDYTRFTTDMRAERYSIQYFIDSVKQEVLSVISDSDGKFKVALKNITYWVFANTTMQGNKSEEYHWLFEYSPSGEPLLLSNENKK
jgi:hypothetical protein